MQNERILVVEDEEDIRELIAYHLRREGYEVLQAHNGLDALSLIKEKNPDLVLLDLMLPGMDGIEICRRMKQDPLTRDVCIIMVTAKEEESDQVLGLGLGADDYVTKPFRPRALMARVEAVLRRGKLNKDHAASEDVLEHGPLEINREGHEVYAEGRLVPLTATEFKLLHFLASHPGRVFSRGQLLSRVIKDALVTERNIDVHIRSIRKKLGKHRELIQTVRGVGYKMVASP
ncbi:MAG TPA: response regulator [Planctomycetes bacterium]|nr:response regulator [Planctomycetota bacterium]